MPRHLKRNWKPVPAKKTEYLEHPVGSNEWSRQKKIEIEKRRLDKKVADEKKKLDSMNKNYSGLAPTNRISFERSKYNNRTTNTPVRPINNKLHK